MPTETNQNATMYVGKVYDVRFTEVDADDLSAFNDLTYAFADSGYSASNHFTKSQSGGGITISGSSNEIAVVRVAATDTDPLDPGGYYHELETVDSQGNEQVAAVGEVTLKPSRTN